LHSPVLLEVVLVKLWRLMGNMSTKTNVVGDLQIKSVLSEKLKEARLADSLKEEQGDRALIIYLISCLISIKRAFRWQPMLLPRHVTVLYIMACVNSLTGLISH
jgi:hypothetical protein